MSFITPRCSSFIEGLTEGEIIPCCFTTLRFLTFNSSLHLSQRFAKLFVMLKMFVIVSHLEKQLFDDGNFHKCIMRNNAPETRLRSSTESCEWNFKSFSFDALDCYEKLLNKIYKIWLNRHQNCTSVAVLSFIQNKLHVSSICLFSFSVPFPMPKANKILIRFSSQIYGSLEASKCLTSVLNWEKLWLPRKICRFDVQYEESRKEDEDI